MNLRHLAGALAGAAALVSLACGAGDEPLQQSVAGAIDAPPTAAQLLEDARSRGEGVRSGRITQSTTIDAAGITLLSDLTVQFDSASIYSRSTIRDFTSEALYEGNHACSRAEGRPWRRYRLSAAADRPLRNLNLGSETLASGGLEQLPDAEEDGIVFHHFRIVPSEALLLDTLSQTRSLLGRTPVFESMQLDLYIDREDLLIKRIELDFVYEVRGVASRGASTLRLTEINAPTAFPDDLPTSCSGWLATLPPRTSPAL